MKKLFAYAGKLGSGKNYCMMQKVDQLKDIGHTLYLVSFADPIKQILRDSFGLEKSGRVDAEIRHFTKKYVKDEVVGSLFNLIKNIDYEQFKIYEPDDVYELFEQNYDKHEDIFYQHLLNAMLNEDYDYNFRKLAQLLGTELARHVVDTIWVDIAFDRVQKAFTTELADFAFCPDLRFLNEYQMLLNFEANTGFVSEIYGITASDETRASRRGLSVDELNRQDQHGSEKEVDTIIQQLSSEFIIVNN